MGEGLRTMKDANGNAILNGYHKLAKNHSEVVQNNTELPTKHHTWSSVKSVNRWTRALIHQAWLHLTMIRILSFYREDTTTNNYLTDFHSWNIFATIAISLSTVISLCMYAFFSKMFIDGMSSDVKNSLTKFMTMCFAVLTIESSLAFAMFGASMGGLIHDCTLFTTNQVMLNLISMFPSIMVSFAAGAGLPFPFLFPFIPCIGYSMCPDPAIKVSLLYCFPFPLPSHLCPIVSVSLAAFDFSSGLPSAALTLSFYQSLPFPVSSSVTPGLSLFRCKSKYYKSKDLWEKWSKHCKLD